MITRWFKDTFIVTRREWNNEFNPEPFKEVARIKGFIQPITGRVAHVSGKETPEEIYRLYTPKDSDVAAGDRVIDKYGVTWVVTFGQTRGIAGVGDHQELTVELLP